MYMYQVLTLQQFRELSSPGPPKDTQLAKALFDFKGQTDKELSFSKVHVHDNSRLILIHILGVWMGL